MKNIKKKLSENFHFLVVKFSIYLNRDVFVMLWLKQQIVCTGYSKKSIKQRGQYHETDDRIF